MKFFEKNEVKNQIYNKILKRNEVDVVQHFKFFSLRNIFLRLQIHIFHSHPSLI